MPLPTFDSKDAIPEPFREAYAEKDGKWVPTVEDASGIKRKADELLSEKKALETALAGFKGALGDLKPEDAAEILKAHRSSEEERARKAGEFDKLLEKRLGEVRSELEPKVKAGEDAQRELADLRFQTATEKLFIAAGGDPAKLEDMIAVTKGKRLRQGAKGVEVLDADGDLTGLTPDKFFAETLKKEKPWLFLGSGAGGGGSNGGGGGKGGAGAGVVSASDTAAFLANLEGIASGKVRVTQ